ncbi:sigma-54-dependent Fis family transcriptional regulator [Paucibacter sp. DJ1R-11]|uniref:sigma-54-dependent Fis family transcriptional regulator n=1 Tax=Paucibacter sp. DJ1R-11 TaxID=2893556 RepID=UPI0021E3D0C8|nr:sigma-54-dependent Fis family transcriptional regulator [Paucibacter sp. DJ1R-11]MCV2363592.1 sigma-54-dependent Fis family transcriptional regulator [Paucibacter sp. DJ1R-11]
MTANALMSLRAAPSRLRQARRQLLETGELADGLLDPRLQASWLRSRAFGLTPEGRAQGVPHASAAQLARSLEQRRALLAQARPVMEFVADQVKASDSLVILADPQGMLLHALGDDGFADKAARVALRPGAVWLEQWRGSNAIGTALADGRPVVINGAEHFLERNGFLTCAAAPIADSSGALLGVLDISGDRRGYHPHTLGLARSAARMIEHQLFQARHGSGLVLRLHARPEGLDTVTEGLLALADDGVILGANGLGLEWLSLNSAALGRCTVEAALGLSMQTLLGDGLLAQPRQLQRADGSLLSGRLDGARPRARAAVSVPAVSSPAVSALTALPARSALPDAVVPSSDALSALDTGDAGVQGLLSRARRVLGKPIALLLQGESGVGKELLARACHQSGPRRNGPFVAINCAALPESLIEAELFGYRPGAFTGALKEGAPGLLRQAHGGTLFLDEIGDMPLALQARLLRVLQERQVSPLGGGPAVAVDFALICASHRRLRDEVESQRFREDLYYRINGLSLLIPPLRQRSDFATLVERLLKDAEPTRKLSVAPELLAALGAHPWPGNLRQLANVLRTCCALLDGAEAQIDWSHLPDDIAEDLNAAAQATRAAALPPLTPAVDSALDLRLQSSRCVQQALALAQGNRSEAARRLGVSRNTLYRKMREAGLEPEQGGGFE